MLLKGSLLGDHRHAMALEMAAPKSETATDSRTLEAPSQRRDQDRLVIARAHEERDRLTESDATSVGTARAELRPSVMGMGQMESLTDAYMRHTNTKEVMPLLCLLAFLMGLGE